MAGGWLASIGQGLVAAGNVGVQAGLRKMEHNFQEAMRREDRLFQKELRGEDRAAATAAAKNQALVDAENTAYDRGQDVITNKRKDATLDISRENLKISRKREKRLDEAKPEEMSPAAWMNVTRTYNEERDLGMVPSVGEDADGRSIPMSQPQWYKMKMQQRDLATGGIGDVMQSMYPSGSASDMLPGQSGSAGFLHGRMSR